jgi:hypothetical protein
MTVQMIESMRRRRSIVLVTSALAGTALAVSGCGGNGSGAGSSAARVASYVPSGSPLYLEASTDFDGPQWSQVDGLAKLFPAYPTLRTMIDDALKSDDVDFETEIKPLLGAHAAIAGLALPDTAALQGSLTNPTAGAAAKAADDLEFVGVVELADGKDDAVTALLVKSGASKSGNHGGIDYYTDAPDAVIAVTDGVLVVSDTKEQLFSALDVHAAGGDKTLAGTAKFTDALGKLPADVFGQAYIDVGAIAQSAGQTTPELGQLGLADYQNAVVAASIAAEPGGARVKGVIVGAPDAGIAEFSPSLTDTVPADAIAYIGFNDLAGTVTTILDQARAAQSDDTAAQIEAIGGQIPALLGVSLADLSALTSGEHALVVTSGSPNPGAALVLKVADGAQATTTLDALRVGIPQLLQTFGSGTTLPAWKQVPLAAGVKGWELPLSPEAGAVYGVDGDRAIIGTSVPAVIAVQRPIAPLSQSAGFTAATSGMPDGVTSLMWLNISAGVDAARKLGALDGAPAESLANLRPLKSIAAWTTGGETPTFEVFVSIAG